MPDPTVILQRQRRPRGLVISMSVLVTLGLAIGGGLALTRMQDETAAGEPGQAASTGDAVVAASAPGEAIAATGEPAAPGSAADTANSAADTPGEAPGQAAQASDEPGATASATAPGDTERAQARLPGASGRTPAQAAQAERAPARPTATAERGEPAAAREREPAWIALTVTPSSAAVTVDGDTYRGAALQRVGPLEAGAYTLRVTAPGHETLEQPVELSAGETERMSLTLAPTATGPAKVRIRSTPAGASVVIDGKVRGITPVTLDLAAGKNYELTLSHAGYDTWRTLIEPTAGKTLEVETALVQLAGSAPVVAGPSESGSKERDIAVPASVVGDAGRGRALFERCRNCHGSKAPITPRSQTQGWWTRFLASRRHARHAELRSVFSASELADVKAFLLENAADVDRGMAAGVR
jgi:hypothetical protein